MKNFYGGLFHAGNCLTGHNFSSFFHATFCNCLWRSIDVTPSHRKSVQFELGLNILILRILVKFCVHSRVPHPLFTFLLQTVDYRAKNTCLYCSFPLYLYLLTIKYNCMNSLCACVQVFLFRVTRP